VEPRTRYARSGDVRIAYQVVGKGPLDLVLVPGAFSHIELWWEDPAIAGFLRRLASFSRLILFDKRGTGLSDRVPDTAMPSIEQRMDDVRAVMDAAGSTRAGLLGFSEGGPMAALFAATYPERVQALVMYGTFARWFRSAEHPWGLPPEALGTMIEAIDQHWGEGITLPMAVPSQPDTAQAREQFGRMERFAASPGAMIALVRMAADIDVRHVLPAIHVPALVVHRREELMVPVECARYLAAHIPGARYLELPGVDHVPWAGDVDTLVGELQEFLTGARATSDPDRVLATVLFTDIVASTERAATLGDRGWRDLLERHQALVRRELARFLGREVKTLGDGFLATFDGPARAIRCASAIRDGIRLLGIEIKSGLHTGECELMGKDVAGIAVHIAARVAATAAPGEVLVSSTVKDLVVGSGLSFGDRGMHNLHGVPGEWRLFAVGS
jgi:pimeloyl-ACP methyl ester carboxylesterase/class 3 adenylate cyclase